MRVLMKRARATLSERTRRGGWLLVVLGTLAIGACDGQPKAKSVTGVHVSKAVHAPSYRGGQYCLPASDHRYKLAGFSCEDHHLVKR